MKGGWSCNARRRVDVDMRIMSERIEKRAGGDFVVAY